MHTNKSISYKPLLISLAISLGAGGLSALITGNSTQIYPTLNRPPLSPPGVVFPIVWSILYVLLGIAAYLIYITKAEGTRRALTVYGIQLLVNVCWSPLFFRAQAFLPAFMWLVLLWLLIAATLVVFYRIKKAAAALLLPYFIWVTFAGYLNLGIFLLNR